MRLLSLYNALDTVFAQGLWGTESLPRAGVVVLPICPSCGKVNREGANFCAFCAAPLARPAGPAPAAPPPAPPRSQDECFGTPREERRQDECFGTPRREPGPPGAVNFAFFLFIVGIVFLANPGLFTDFEAWVNSFTPGGGVPRPAGSMIVSAIIFFAAAGVFDFVTAGIRVAMKGRRRKVLSDVLTGVAWIVLAGFTNLYLGKTISGPVVIASELVVIGLLIIVYLLAVSRPRALSPPV